MTIGIVGYGVVGKALARLFGNGGGDPLPPLRARRYLRTSARRAYETFIGRGKITCTNAKLPPPRTRCDGGRHRGDLGEREATAPFAPGAC